MGNNELHQARMQIIERESEIKTLRTQLAEAQTECEEQARLNGMGSERELKLVSQLANERAEHFKAREQLAERDAQLAAVSSRYEWLLDEPEGATHLLNLLKNKKGTKADFSAMIDRIKASKATRQPTQDKGDE